MRPRIVAGLLALSATGLISIAGHEAWRARTYDDGVGVNTIGWGHTGEAARPGAVLSVDRGLILLGNDASVAERTVQQCLGDVPMTQGEFDAYTSLAFNVGHGGNGRDGVCRNRHNQPSIIVRKLRAGDYAGACEAIELFNRAGGRVLPGLQKRRAHERALCEGRQ